MKNKIIASLSLAVVCLALVLNTWSCKPGEFGDINISPNAVTTPLTSALLTNSIARMGTIGDAQTIRSMAILFPGLYAQYFSQSQYTDESTYSTVQPGWNDIYAGPLKDIQTIIDYNSDPVSKINSANLANGSNANQIATARILKAYFMWHITDLWGDAPYSEALKGETNVQPKYDAQQDIYKDLFKELREAVAQFDAGATVKGDVLFSGDIAKWKKFANSMRVIMALRISKADAVLGAAEVKDAITSGVVEAVADNVTLIYPGGTIKHPFYEEYDGRKDYSISNTVANFLNTNGDPRLKIFGNPSSAGVVAAVPYGVARADALAFTTANPAWSFVLAASYRTDASPYDILTAADVYLARAEAAKLGWTTENATTNYNTGIKASFQGWKIAVTAADSIYINSTNVKLNGDANDLKKIGTQRWLAFYPRGTQGWSEWRRTGFPTLTPSVAAVNSSKQIPRRYNYPSTEPNLNKASYNAAISRLNGGDTPDSRVWWDK